MTSTDTSKRLEGNTLATTVGSLNVFKQAQSSSLCAAGTRGPALYESVCVLSFKQPLTWV